MPAVGGRAAALRYTSVARARRKPVFSAISAEVVQDYLTAAEAWVDRWTGRSGFDTSSRTEVYDGGGHDCLRLRAIPITSITSITITDADGSTEALTISTDVDYDTGLKGEVRFGPNNASSYAYWPSGFRNISVVYTAGYAVGSVPDDIQEAVIHRALALHMETSLYMAAGLKSQKIGDGSQQRISREDVDLVMDRVYELLGPYKRLEVL